MTDLILKNGYVYTMDASNPEAEAVAVNDGMIVAVGTNEEIMQLKTESTRVLDLMGRMLLPGFIDAHCHPSMCAFFADGVIIDEDMTIPEVEACIKDYINKHPQKKAYFGIGYDECLYDERGPKKEDLDMICSDKPIMILGSSGHEGWCNSEALIQAGITRDVPDPVPGFQYFERDGEGDPTGHLVESETESMVFDNVEFFDKEAVYRNYVELSDSYSSMGVTSVVSCGDFDWMEKISIAMIEELTSKDDFKQRLVGCVFVNMKNKKETMLEELKKRSEKYNTDRYKVDVYKILLDGTMETRSASLSEPYDEDGRIVEPLFTEEELKDICINAASLGFDIHIHAIGDKAVHNVLMAAEAVRKAGYDDTRITNAHTDYVQKEDRKLFKKYNVTANTTGVWHYGNSDLDKIIGKERAAQQFTMKDIIDSGGRISLGSDRPVDEYGPEPLNSIEVAVTRKLMDDPDAPVLPPKNQRLSVQDCLKGYTINAAYQMHMEDKLGSIEKGKYADLVVLDENLFEIDDSEIHKVKVNMTLINGEIVFAQKRKKIKKERF